MKIKVGFGFDVHQLQEGRDFIIGGVKIPHSKGALGHSDADALIHAICDALLGAAGLKDIGFYFPDTSAEFKGIDSKILLKRVVDLISEKGYTIGNVDVSLVLEKPKIKPYIDEMINTLAPILKVELDDISIKATTNEKMGYVGREEGIAAYAVCLISKI
ncbi:MAG: 2-C-methyl-D-erythritol 2,4-cyclodiphosphate synthase [Bacteroidia bacterium]|jgi:2-C-methyl-D-erythritol 2,4-cyclodiphosphate synthase|nr:2-C-methyl-D-erythritol 2,4-cyclodiphosphate synthase [Bacteroidia bacterium]MBP7244456.1 2-C-methyl-D-erythritol 2,4-cyclodiphosphate synthase [Bacteroidia bacterium]